MMAKLMRIWPAAAAAILVSSIFIEIDGFPRPSTISIRPRGHTFSSRHPSPTRRRSDGDISSILSKTLSSPYHHHDIAGIHHRTTKLYMSDDDNEGPGLVTKIFISGVLLFFVASAFAPLTLFADKQTPTDLSLGDSVVTRQDGNKLKTYQSSFDALSPAVIQEKLSNLPVFFLSTNGGSIIEDNFYLSYDEAENAAAKSSSAVAVKVTALDQIMYPLILKRGDTIKTKGNTPAEIKSAKDAGANASSKTYNLIPSKAAINDAKDMTLKEGDIPLFVVERLAFAGNDGRPQVPLFTERGDAITSYERLDKPDKPSIRTTSLLDVLDSMERGTRPGVGQLQFYGNANDVLKADEMSQP